MKYIPMFRNLALCDTLFHEIGHHLDRTIGSPTHGSEATAEAWRARLLVAWFRKRYWYLAPFLRVGKKIEYRWKKMKSGDDNLSKNRSKRDGRPRNA